MTPQGRAIKQAAIDFGNGQTLPFTPCKKGYIPILVEGKKRRVACPLHNKAREKRLAKEKGKFRDGEVDLNIFWSKYEGSDGDVIEQKEKKDQHQKTTDKTKVAIHE
jgi:hypothetical protein